MEISMKVVCPVCKRKFATVNAAVDHIDSTHQGCCPPNITPKQWIFNVRNRLPIGTTHGKSILSGRPTQWNEKLGKYERLCGESERQEFRKVFVARMLRTYKKETLLNDPDVQKKMLQRRKISGTYKFGKDEIPYTGSYELDFIRFLDTVLDWDPKDLFMPCPMVIEYTSPRDNKVHFYIPDAYLASLKLIVEIKSEDNKHYRKRDIDIENAKDAAMAKQELVYVKIFDKDYTDFLALVNTLRG
jgi:hypothetical protein